MVKFGQYLRKHLVVEWAEKYVKYKALKKKLKRLALAREEERKAEANLDHIVELIRSDRPQAKPAAGAARDAELAARSQSERALRKGRALQTEVGEEAVTSPRISRVRETDAADGMDRSARVPTREMRRMTSSVALTGDHLAKDNPLQHTFSGMGGGEPVEEYAMFHMAVPEDTPAVRQEREFFALVQAELKMVEDFYRKQQSYFLEKTNQLVQQANRVLHWRTHGELDERVRKKNRVLHRLKRAMLELHRGLELLANYRILNYTAFVKILKKHDKHSSFKSSPIILKAVESGNMFTSVLTEEMTEKTAEMFAEVFHGGDLSAGRKRLRVVKQETSPLVTFRLGMLVGVAIGLLFVLLFISRIIPNINKTNYFFAPFPVFRCTALVILHMWLWAADTFLYIKFGVNYLFIFEADFRSHLKVEQLLQFAASTTVAWLGLFDLYLVSWARGPSVQEPWLEGTAYIHLLAFFVLVAILLIPFRTAYYYTRSFLLRGIFDAMTAPFGAVNFRSFFLADQLTSLVRVKLDLVYTFCFYFTGDFEDNESDRCKDMVVQVQWFVALLPYWFRFAQCMRRYVDTRDAWPHLANAGKYVSAMVVTTFSALASQDSRFTVPWICVAAFGTIYAATWDVVMDWGFFKPGSSQYGYLRSRLMIPLPNVYYAVICFNFLLRLAWVLSISPDSLGLSFNAELLLFLVGALEVYRRCQWNFFRVENEHLNNVGKFRAVDVVPLVVHVDDEESEHSLSGSRGKGSQADISEDSDSDKEHREARDVVAEELDDHEEDTEVGDEHHDDEVSLHEARPGTRGRSFSDAGADERRSIDPLSPTGLPEDADAIRGGLEAVADSYAMLDATSESLKHEASSLRRRRQPAPHEKFVLQRVAKEVGTFGCDPALSLSALRNIVSTQFAIDGDYAFVWPGGEVVADGEEAHVTAGSCAESLPNGNVLYIDC